jgi:hypothetical protein
MTSLRREELVFSFEINLLHVERLASQGSGRRTLLAALNSMLSDLFTLFAWFAMSQLNSTNQDLSDSESTGYGSPGYEASGYDTSIASAFGAETTPLHIDRIRNPLQSNIYDATNLGDSPYRETLANSSPQLSGYSILSMRSQNSSYSDIGDSAELEL